MRRAMEVARRMHNTVHLQKVRCDGSAHDGCQESACHLRARDWILPSRY
jgi:hypothetical protein